MWRKPSGEVYHRIVRGFYSDYLVGSTNNYGHVLIYTHLIEVPYGTPKYNLLDKFHMFLEKGGRR